MTWLARSESKPKRVTSLAVKTDIISAALSLSFLGRSLSSISLVRNSALAMSVHASLRDGASSDSYLCFANEKFFKIVVSPPPCEPSRLITAV